MTTLDLTYKITYLITMLITTWAAGAIWRRRSAPGAPALFMMMLAIIEWNLSGLMEISATNAASDILWAQIAYLGSWTAQPLFLIFVLDYTRLSKWVTHRNVALLFIMPVITILLALTNQFHNLIWAGILPGADGHIIYLHGAWFWVSVVYINIIMVLGTGLLIRFTLRTNEPFRHQNIGLVTAALFPWLGFSLYVSPFNPFPGLDITALSFALTGSVLVFIISRLSFLNIIPIAREFLVENMLDGLLVLDHHNRVIDINAAAMSIFNIKPGSKWVGVPVQELLPNQDGLGAYFESLDKLEVEWEQTSPQSRFFDLQVLPLYQHANHLTGRSVIFRDITHRKNIEAALWQANSELGEKLLQIETLKDELRELSIRDALTGLFNRRYIEEIFTLEIGRAKREGYPLTLVILDLDLFKMVNDQFGHARGDDVLRAMGDAFRKNFRGSDIACRYGGDEFMLMMPTSSARDAFRRIESFRHVCAGLHKEQGADLPPISFSAGIATYPEHAESTQELFRIADQTLYLAKTQGRNRTCLP